MKEGVGRKEGRNMKNEGSNMKEGRKEYEKRKKDGRTMKEGRKEGI